MGPGHWPRRTEGSTQTSIYLGIEKAAEAARAASGSGRIDRVFSAMRKRSSRPRSDSQRQSQV